VSRTWQLVALVIAFTACATPREPAMHVHVPPAVAGDADDITVSWIGHATLLVGIRGHWLLTDPVAVPEPGAIPRHQRFYYLELLRRAGILDQLPEAESLRLDRTDLPSLRRLPDAPLLVPSGMPASCPAICRSTGWSRSTPANLDPRRRADHRGAGVARRWPLPGRSLAHAKPHRLGHPGRRANRLLRRRHRLHRGPGARAPRALPHRCRLAPGRARRPRELD
jgi:hypothetical protein